MALFEQSCSFLCLDSVSSSIVCICSDSLWYVSKSSLVESSLVECCVGSKVGSEVAYHKLSGVFVFG
jgi:hypothetical protein